MKLQHVIRRVLGSRDGYSMVSAMLALSLLAIFAMVAASMAANESKTSFNELVHQRSFLAADSGGEAAVAWLMTLDRPPMFDDFDEFRVKRESANTLYSSASQKFDFDVDMMDRTAPDGTREARIAGRPGYDFKLFRDHFYEVDADGQDGRDGRGAISLVAQRIFRVGY